MLGQWLLASSPIYNVTSADIQEFIKAKVAGGG